VSSSKANRSGMLRNEGTLGDGKKEHLLLKKEELKKKKAGPEKLIETGPAERSGVKAAMTGSFRTRKNRTATYQTLKDRKKTGSGREMRAPAKKKRASRRVKARRGAQPIVTRRKNGRLS